MKILLKKIWLTIFRKHPQTILGNLLNPFMTTRSKKIMNSFFAEQKEGFIDRCLRSAINDRYYRQDDKTIRETRAKLWGADLSREWHDYNELEAARNYAERMRFRTPLVEWIKAYAKANPSLQLICQVGTGMGHLLFILREEVSKVSNCKFVGLDLNQACIEEANKRNHYDDVVFLNSEGQGFISEKGVPNSLFVFSGTLEYFTQKELENTLELIKAKKPAAIAISEPINLDITSEYDSKPRGNIAFSHNYVHLLNKHGYRVLHKKIEKVNPKIPFYECVMMLAEV